MNKVEPPWQQHMCPSSLLLYKKKSDVRMYVLQLLSSTIHSIGMKLVQIIKRVYAKFLYQKTTFLVHSGQCLPGPSVSVKSATASHTTIYIYININFSLRYTQNIERMTYRKRIGRSSKFECTHKLVVCLHYLSFKMWDFWRPLQAIV